jgi:hypothetical protein
VGCRRGGERRGAIVDRRGDKRESERGMEEKRACAGSRARARCCASRCASSHSRSEGPVGSNHTKPQPAGTQGCFFGDILVVVPG